MNSAPALVVGLLFLTGEEPPKFGRDSAPIGIAAHSIEIPAGTAVRVRPAADAPVLLLVDEPTFGEWIETRGNWQRIHVGALRGWIDRSGSPPETADSQSTDSERVRIALELLEGETLFVDAGGLRLHTERVNADRLARWARVAALALEAWPARVGMTPVDSSGIVVVMTRGGGELELGSDPDDPLALTTPISAPGSAGGGVAIVRLGDRDPEAVEALLVHELSHLASERRFPNGLPLWLEEGIAEWLSRESIGAEGATLPGTLRGEIVEVDEARGHRVDLFGPIADLALLARQAEEGTLPALSDWTSLPWAEFVAPAQRPHHYALAGSFVRFLFESEPERAARVRQTLAASIGDPALDLDSELSASLGGAGRLDREFRDWLRSDSAARVGDGLSR